MVGNPGLVAAEGVGVERRVVGVLGGGVARRGGSTRLRERGPRLTALVGPATNETADGKHCRQDEEQSFSSGEFLARVLAVVASLHGFPTCLAPRS